MAWPATSTARTAIDLGTTLASDTFSAAGTEIDNSTNKDQLFWAELATSTGNLFGSGVSRANASIDIYLIQAPDGTNYANIPDVRGEFGFPLVSIPVPTEAEVVPIVVGPFMFPPHKVKAVAYNNTDQTMQNTWEVNFYTNSP